MADRLEELAHFFPDRVDLVDRIAEHARETDRLTTKLRLTATFVTPIEREDLEALAGQVDDLVRSVRIVAVLLSVYRVERVHAPARRLTQLLGSCAKELRAAIGLLRAAGDVGPHTAEIRVLTDEAETPAREGLGELFTDDASAIELVRWKDLYEKLEAALGAARRAAVTLDVISSKHR